VASKPDSMAVVIRRSRSRWQSLLLRHFV